MSSEGVRINQAVVDAAIASPPTQQSTLRARGKRLLESPRLGVLLAALVCALALPSLGFGLQADDHLLLLNATTGAPQWALYSAQPEDLAHARQIGALGWWSSTDLTVRFVRPLASLSHALDFQFWPGAAALMHVINLLSYAALVWLGVLLYRRLLPDPRLSGLAALMFAVDDGHAQSVGWISGRNTLLVTFSVLATLLAHIKDRDQGARFSLVSVLCLGVSLLLGEAGIAGATYLLAYCLCFEAGSIWQRLRTITPQLGLIAVWALGYLAFGGGTHGMTLYRGLGAPLDTLGQGVLDLPTWLLSLLGPSLVSVSLAVPVWPMRLVCLALVSPLLLLVWPAFKRSPHARFFALGSLLCLLPLFATMPQDRLLMGASFGAFGLIACLFEQAMQADTRVRWGRRVFIGLHVVAAPLFFVANLNGAGMVENGVQKVVAHVPELSGREAILVNSPTELLNPYALSAAYNAGIELPQSFHQLYSGEGELHVTRTDERTLEVVVDTGWGGPPLAATVRDPIPGVPRVGDVVERANLTVHVLEATAAGMPSRVRFEFPSALEDPNRSWFAWQSHDLVPWTPPAVGQRVVLQGEHSLVALVQ